MPNVGTKTITTGSGGGTTSLAIKRRELAAKSAAKNPRTGKVRGVTTMKVGQSEQVPVGTRMLGSPAKSGRKGSLK
jgi:hypothetical protein